MLPQLGTHSQASEAQQASTSFWCTGKVWLGLVAYTEERLSLTGTAAAW